MRRLTWIIKSVSPCLQDAVLGNRSMPSLEFRGGMDRVAHPWQQKFKMTKSLKEDLVTGESFVVLSTMKIYVHNSTNTNLCVLSPSPPPQQHQQQATARQFDEPQQQPNNQQQNKTKQTWKGLMGGIRSPFLAHSPLAGGWVEGCVYTRLPHQSVGR